MSVCVRACGRARAPLCVCVCVCVCVCARARVCLSVRLTVYVRVSANSWHESCVTQEAGAKRKLPGVCTPFIRTKAKAQR